jgi:hypothetical protein
MLLDERTSQPLLGRDTKATVSIIDNDEPGYLAFSEEVYTINPKATEAKITVQRRKGAAGEVTCFLRIENAVEDPHDEEDLGIPRPEIYVEPMEVHFADA